MLIQTRPETADIEGFDQVVHGTDGQLVTFDAYLDAKGICGGLEPQRNDVCTIRILSSDAPGNILVRIRICSDERATDCLQCRNKDGESLPFHEVRAVSSAGKQIDFLGYRKDGSSNTWIQDERPLTFTGRVTVIDGVGRIIEPIEKINAAETTSN